MAEIILGVLINLFMGILFTRSFENIHTSNFTERY